MDAQKVIEKKAIEFVITKESSDFFDDEYEFLAVKLGSLAEGRPGEIWNLYIYEQGSWVYVVSTREKELLFSAAFDFLVKERHCKRKSLELESRRMSLTGGNPSHLKMYGEAAPVA